jgi:hypothetical protein
LGSKIWTLLSLFPHAGWRLGKESMSLDDLGLLLGVIEIQMVLQILVHGVRFDVL